MASASRGIPSDQGPHHRGGAGSTKEEPEWGVMETDSGGPEEPRGRLLLLGLRVWMHAKQRSEEAGCLD